MATLVELPTEILRLIFSVLIDINLLSMFKARDTCRFIQTATTDIFDKTIKSHGATVHDLIKSQFAPLLGSWAAGAAYQPSIGQLFALYAAPPWALSPERRARYSRMEASWRQLPPASSSVRLVHTLQMVEQGQIYTPGVISNLAGGVVGFRMMVVCSNRYRDVATKQK
jgi:hypothetical protein